MSKALSTVKRALVRDRIKSALDRVGWAVAEDAAFRESVQTPFEKCRAKDKLSCKYHGAQALFKILSQELPDVGIGTYKTSDGGYAANIDVSAEEAKNAIGKALEGMGYEITNAVDISDGQSQIFIAKKEAPSDEIDNLSPDESMEAGLEELDKFLEDNLTEEDEATLAEMEALLEEDALGSGEENENTPLSECKAADPLTCPYHGVKVLTNVVMGAFPGLSEANGDYEVDMADNGGFYIDIKATSDEVKQKIEPFLNTIGYEVKSAKDYDFDGTSLVKIGKKEIAEEKNGTVPLPAAQKPTEAKPKKGKGKASKKVAEALENAGFVADIPEGILPPLEHDDEKFPQGITQDELDDAIKHGKKAGGHGGLGTTIVKIGGKKYVCKSGSGKKASIIKNGYNADMAYRAGGIFAPDAQLYDFGDGKTYKLSEFVEGKRLIDVWKNADEAERDKIRSELLKGYPLDVLFSNYDVLGTSPEEAQSVTVTGPDGKPMHTSVAFDNVIIGNDGHAYRIDNDGAFAMTGTGGVKHVEPGQFGGKVAYETWDKWQDRQWIDDFRTLRRNPKNAGVFDRYSTADIFLSAGNINLGHAVDSLPEPLQKALSKPLAEMKEMVTYAKGADVAGYHQGGSYSWKDANGQQHTVQIDPMSIALDSIYEANKTNAREVLQNKISWYNLGWLSGHQANQNVYQAKPFTEPEPPEPKPPAVGTDLAKEVLEGIKTINYHAKQGDGNVNQSRIKKALAVKPMLEVLSADGNEKAKGLLEAVAKIEDSVKNGHGKEIKFNTPDGFLDVNGLSIPMTQENVDKFNSANKGAHDEWAKAHKKWSDDKEAWDKAEKRKAIESGAAPETSFQKFEDAVVTAAMDTDGIPHGGGDPSVNHSSKSAQKGTSFSLEACKKKVRQYAMMGIPLDQMFFKNNDPVFYNGNIENGGHHVSGSDGKGNWVKAVKYYQSNPDQFKKDMESYARHKGMLAMVHANMDNAAIDKETGTVFVMRGEHKQAWGKDGKGAPTKTGIIKPYPIDSSTSACINDTGHFGSKKIGWKLPLWRVTDNFMIGAGSEEEICINPIKIPYPPMYFADTGGGWQACMDLYNQQPEVKAIDKKMGKTE